MKSVGAAAVVEGVENDLDLIVVEDVLAAGHAGPHFAGIVEAYEDHVQIFLVVAEVGVGGLGNIFSIVRIALGEASDLRHLQGDFSPRLHAEEVFQGRRTG